MALTPGGLPYPLGTDKVVDGDDAIRALATALDIRVPVNAGTNAALFPWLGTVPNLVSARLLTHAAVATTDVNGSITISFGATPFATAVLFAIAVTRSGSAQNPVINGGQVTLSNFTVIWPTNPNTSISFVWLALGY